MCLGQALTFGMKQVHHGQHEYTEYEACTGMDQGRGLCTVRARRLVIAALSSRSPFGLDALGKKPPRRSRMPSAGAGRRSWPATLRGGCCLVVREVGEAGQEAAGFGEVL